MTPTPSSPLRGTRPLWTVTGLLLLAGIVVPLLVPAYATAAPTLFGFPFFYWFQFLLIPVVSLLTYVAYRISVVATARDRTARGVDPEPEGTRKEER